MIAMSVPIQKKIITIISSTEVELGDEQLIDNDDDFC